VDMKVLKEASGRLNGNAFLKVIWEYVLVEKCQNPCALNSYQISNFIARQIQHDFQNKG